MYYVCVLISLKRKWIYIGYTNDLKRRFKEHNLGLVNSTKAYKPFVLVYYEAYANKTDARAREYKLKNHSQTREMLYDQIAQSMTKAHSSSA